MEKEKLTKFVLEEFRNTVPQEIAEDDEKSNAFIQKNIDLKLVDTLVEEFCKKNPGDSGVLNVFALTDDELAEIERNPQKAIADGVRERIKYEQIINHAGLAYKSSDFIKRIEGLPDSAFELK